MRAAARWSRKVFKPSVIAQVLREAFTRLGRRSPAPAAKRSAPAARHQDFVLEALEPRLLLSADLSYAATSTTHDFTLKAVSGAISLYETSNLSTAIDTQSISGGGDVNVSIARDDTAGAQALNGDTLRIDLDTLNLLNSAMSGHVLTLDFEGGNERVSTDHVIVNGATGAVGYGLTIQSSSDIASSATADFSAGDFSLLSQQTASDLLDTGLWADSNTGISLSGANFTIENGALNLTAHSDVSVSTDGTGMSAIQGAAVTSFSGATIDIGGNSVLHATDINLTSNVDGTLSASASAATVKLVAVIGAATPSITIEGSSSLTATDSITALSKSEVTINASTSPEAGSGSSSLDAAVVNTTYGSGALLSVSGGATLDATGTASLTASSKLTANTTADANVAGSAGAAVAVSVITGDTTGSVNGATVDGGTVTLAASSNRTITTLAKSSPGGSSASGDSSNASEQTLSNNHASTSDGDITVAGAVAVSTDTGDTEAFLNDATVGAGTGTLTVKADSTDVVSVTADGEFTGNTGSTTNGVGVAVAIDVADRSDLAYIGGTSDITAGTLMVQVLAPSQSSFTASATAGVGSASNVGFAGSLAINVVVTEHLAYVDDGAGVTLHGNPDVTLEAHSNVKEVTKALPADGGGDGTKVGIGASVAFGYGQDTTAAYFGDTVGFTGAHNLTLTADSQHQMETDATSGGKGGTAITPVVAISVANNDAYAQLGGGGLLTIGGDFKADSSLADSVATTATGDTKSSSTGVGISIALAVVNDTSLATTGRDLLTASGAVSFISSTTSASQSSAKASVAGGEEDDGNPNNSEGTGDQSVTSKTNSQLNYANTESGDQHHGAKGTNSTSAPDSSTSDGKVSVAGAVAVNLEIASSEAYVDGHNVTAGGTVTISSAANVDGSASADGSAVIAAVGGIEFDPTKDGVVDTSANTIDLGGAHGLKTGDAVVYHHGDGGSDIGGLTDGHTYYVYIDGSNLVHLYNTQANANTHDGSTGVIDLTSTGSGTKHSLKASSAAATNGAAVGVAIAINYADVTNLAYAGATTISAGALTISASTGERDLTFDPSSKVSTGDDTIDVGDSGLRTGDAVTYDHGTGGSDIGGLSNDTVYYVNVQSDGKLKLYDTRAHALAGGSDGLKDLTSAGSGSAHKLIDKTDSFNADATSGAGGGKTGVAGSLALNIATTDTEADLGYHGATPTVTITGGVSGDVALTAESDVYNTARALPSDGGGDGSKVGVGISVAFNYGENSTLALLGDDVQLSGAHGLALDASSDHDMITEAKGGAKGSTAVTPVVSISVSDNDTEATLGSDSLAHDISLSGNFSAQAALTSKVETSATGDTQSDDTGVGISIAVTVANDSSLATTARNLSAGGTMTFSASTVSGSSSSASASVAGGEPDDGNSGNSSGTGDQSVTQKTSDQLSFADNKSKEKNSSAKGTQGASAPSSSTSDGQVSVAGAVGVNIELATAKAYIPDVAIVSGGLLTVESAANVDGTATANGSAVLGAIEFDPTAAGVVDTSANTIDLGGAHGLKTGDKVHYLAGNDDTAIGGLTDDHDYYVNVQSDGKLKLYDTKAHAQAGGDVATGGLVDLTSAGTGTHHIFQGVGKGGTGVGVAVTVNYAEATNLAYVDSTNVSAGGMTIQATMAADGSDKTDTFSAQSTSGAGGGKTGVAGSVAINIAFTDTEATLDPAAHVAITGGGDVSIKAESDASNTAKALPSDGGGSGSSVGVGISVAVNYGQNETYAQMGDGSVLTGAHNLDLEATSGQDMVTDAKSGAKGSTGVTPVVSVAISAEDTDATIGSGGLLTITGELTDKATLTDKLITSAEGDTKSSDTGVGISVAVAVVNDDALATTARNLSAGGAVTFSASTASLSDAEAMASVKGGQQDNNSGSHTDNGTDQSVDNTTNAQTGFGDSKAKEKNSSAKGAQGASQHNASTSDGSVSVAGAVAVAVENGSAQAYIPDSGQVTAGGLLSVTSAANVDGHAVADGSASTASGGTGVGVAVSVNVASITNEAYIGDGAVIHAGGLTVSATMADRSLKPTASSVNVVDTAKDTIFLGLASGLKTGDEVLYSPSDPVGDTAVGGLSTGSSYYVNVKSDGTVKLYDTKANAVAGGSTGLVNLTSGATGTEHDFYKYVTVEGVSAPDLLDPIKFNPTGTVVELSLGSESGMRVGDAVEYKNGGGTSIPELTDGTTYYLIDLTGGNFQLAATRQDALDGKAIALTGTGNTAQTLVDQSDSDITQATSGAGGGKIGVAGSVTVNIVTNHTEAIVGRAPGSAGPSTATVEITGGGDVSLAAASTEFNFSKALPSDGGGKGSSVGVGASVAVNVMTNTVTAEITDGTGWSGTAGSFSVSAASDDYALTHGENGASGSDAVGVGIAVVVAQDTVGAYVGTGGEIAASGDMSITASHTGEFITTTDAEAAGSSVGVGASVSVGVVIENVSAQLARSVSTTGGGVTVSSTSTVSSGAQATATVKGEDKDDSRSGGSHNADGQADNAVNGNSNTNQGSTTSLSSASAQGNASSGNSSASSEGGQNQSGVGVAAAVSVNVLIANNAAKVSDGADITAHNAVLISAQAENDASAKAVGAALAMDNSTNIGAGVSVNYVHATNKATVVGGGDGSVINGNGITLEAVTPTGKTDDFVAWGAAAAGGKGSTSIAGSVAINVIDTYDTEASAASDSHLESSGGINVTANAALDPQTLAAAGAFSKGTSIGAAINVAVLHASTTAAINGDADAAGAIVVHAENDLVPSTIVLPFIDTGPQATSVAVAGAAAQGDVAIAGSFIINDIHLDADAHIGASSQINQAALYAVTSGQTVAVEAINDTAITSIAGALGVSTGSVGLGVGLDVEILHKSTQAYIDHDATVNAGGAISVTAESSETMLSVAGTVGVADSAGIAASITIADIHTETDAYIADPTAVEAGGALTISATGTFKTTMIAGSVGVGSSAGIGVANATLVHTDTVQAYIGAGAQVSAGGTLSVDATSSEDILSISAGVAVGGSAGVAGSADVNVLDETTNAYVGDGASVTVTGGGDLSVQASDTTSAISVAGSLAGGGSAAVGVGADVGTYTKHTNAYIGSGVTATVDGNILVGAESGESLISVVAGVSAGSVAVAVDAGAHVFDLHTRAFIGDDPDDAVPSAGAGNVHAQGSVVLSANDLTDINEIVGVLAAGSVGVGAGAGVNVMTKDTEAFIGNGANVRGDGNNVAGLSVNTGRIDTGVDSGASTFDPNDASDQGIETSSGDTLTNAASGDRSSFQAAGHVNSPDLGSMDLTGDGSSSAVTGDVARTTELGHQDGFHGVAVAATNRDEIRTFTISFGAGSVGIGISAGVDVVNATTQAYIGDNATVNGITSGASGSQSVLVGAGDDFYHLSVGVGVGVGEVGIAPTVGVNVIGNTTEAWIGGSATVNALNDIAVEATGKENIVMVGMGVAAGIAGVGGVVDVLSVSNTTSASIHDGATVYAGGDVFVSATDDTKVLELSGALAGGFVGVGGSVGVMLIGKDTSATIGQNAHVDALGAGTGVSGILTGDIDGGTSFHTTTAHGVIVQAQSSEDIIHISAAAGVGFVGVSGAVAVTLIGSNTSALIDTGAQIDQLHQGSANGNQSVYVGASNDVGIQTYVIGIAGGFVGVTGAVDVGTLNNNIDAEVKSGAHLSALNDVEVNAVGLKDLTGYTISGAGGFVGAGASVDVWSVGTTLNKTYSDNSGNSANGVHNDNGDPDSNAAQQSDSGTSLVKQGLGNFSGDGNSNSSSSRVDAGAQAASDGVNAHAPTQSSITTLENSAPVPPGTSAVIHSGATVSAGDAIGVTANDSIQTNSYLGQVSGGVVGAGAAIGIYSIADNVTAADDGSSSAGGNINVSAILNEDVNVVALDMAAGFVGLGAGAVVINDTSLTQASLGSVSHASGASVSADATRNFSELTGQASIGAVGVGATFTRLNVTGGVSASVDAYAVLNNINSLSVSASSTITTNVQTYAVSAGVGATSLNFTFVDVAPTISASIGQGANVHASGTVSVSASGVFDAQAGTFGVSVGGLAIGGSLTQVTLSPTVTAAVGDPNDSANGDVTIDAGSLFVTASTPLSASGYSGRAKATGSGGGIYAGTSTNSVVNNNAHVKSYVASGAALTVAGATVVSAVNTNRQKAEANANVGGVVALGIASSTLTSNTDTEAFIGSNTTLNGGALYVVATGTDDNFAFTNAGSGGAIAGAAAIANTTNTSATNASLGAGDNVTLSGALVIGAAHTAAFNDQITTIAGGLLAGAGASSDHEVTAHTTAAVNSSFGSQTHVQAGIITITANDFASKPQLSSQNVNGTTGGLVSGAGVNDTSRIGFYTLVEVGDYAHLTVPGIANSNSLINLSAANTFDVYDSIAFTTGGALSGAACYGSILADGLSGGGADQAYVTIGSGV
ncbi:MAG TPA: LEPR-XLL domain-containing protein, partial [Burkholderiales bacterium]|nr:LEPR-XLL domain-containing protein [Burkholderiales bacterium]